MLRRLITAGLLAALLSAGLPTGTAWAGRTENLGMRVLPAPGKVKIDGKFDDWDLTGGIFACDNVEAQRDHFACWFHTMYDSRNLYILARWIDQTPMNNPTAITSKEGFRGDCLQVRFIMAPATPKECISHITAWMSNRDKKHVVHIAYGMKFNEGEVADAQKKGARQAFLKNADAKGYSQEIALPWKLLTKDGPLPEAGDKFIMTLEPNFSAGWRTRYRYTTKDIFKRGAPIDRQLTFQAIYCWGGGVLEPKGNVKPWPVRLSDGRQFAVKMQDGVPVVDWTRPTRTPADEDSISVAVPVDIGPPRRLTVLSEPAAGVTITGSKQIVTNSTVICKDKEKVTLAAPEWTTVKGSRYDFARWRIDGIEGPRGEVEVRVTMNMDHTVTAVYAIQAHRLDVQSAPIMGATITGNNRGVTDYMTRCVSGQIVDLTASVAATSGDELYSFVRWNLDGVDQPNALASIQITMNAPHIAKALYKIQPRTPTAQPTANTGGANVAPPGGPAPLVAARRTSIGFVVGLLVLVLLGFALMFMARGRGS